MVIKKTRHFYEASFNNLYFMFLFLCKSSGIVWQNRKSQRFPNEIDLDGFWNGQADIDRYGVEKWSVHSKSG
jgi:hypothetical protein